MYVVAIVFYIYAGVLGIFFVSKTSDNAEASHASLMLRLGSVFYGGGAFIYFALETVNGNSALVSSLACVFVAFQAAFVFIKPRINLNCHNVSKF